MLLPETGFTENQDELSATVHARFDVILKVVVPAGGFTLSVVGDAESVGKNQSILLKDHFRMLYLRKHH